MYNGSYTPVKTLSYSLLLQQALRYIVSLSPYNGLISETILEIMTFALPAAVFFRSSEISPDSVISCRFKFPPRPFFSACAVLSVIFAAGFISDRIFLFIESLKNTQPYMPYMPYIKKSGMVIQGEVSYYILLFIATVPITALTEEIFYRGIVLKTLAVYNRTSALVIQALLFGLLHENPSQFLYAAYGGFFLGLLTLESQSVVFAVIIHMINNAIAFLFLYTDIPGLETLIAVVLAAGAAGLIMIIKRTGTNAGQPVSFGKSLRFFMLSPPMIIYLIFKILLLIVRINC